MVDLAGGVEDLAALIASQARDAAVEMVRHRGREQTATDLGVDLDELEDRRPFYLIVGRSWDWTSEPRPVCPVCGGDAGEDLCLRCDNLQSIRDRWHSSRGQIDPEKAGATIYHGPPEGLLGGVGR